MADAEIQFKPERIENCSNQGECFFANGEEIASVRDPMRKAPLPKDSHVTTYNVNSVNRATAVNENRIIPNGVPVHAQSNPRSAGTNANLHDQYQLLSPTSRLPAAPVGQARISMATPRSDGGIMSTGERLQSNNLPRNMDYRQNLLAQEPRNVDYRQNLLAQEPRSVDYRQNLLAQEPRNVDYRQNLLAQEPRQWDSRHYDPVNPDDRFRDEEMHNRIYLSKPEIPDRGAQYQRPTDLAYQGRRYLEPQSPTNLAQYPDPRFVNSGSREIVYVDPGYGYTGHQNGWFFDERYGSPVYEPHHHYQAVRFQPARISNPAQHVHQRHHQELNRFDEHDGRAPGGFSRELPDCRTEEVQNIVDVGYAQFSHGSQCQGCTCTVHHCQDFGPAGVSPTGFPVPQVIPNGGQLFLNSPRQRVAEDEVQVVDERVYSPLSPECEYPYGRGRRLPPVYENFRFQGHTEPHGQVHPKMVRDEQQHRNVAAERNLVPNHKNVDARKEQLLDSKGLESRKIQDSESKKENPGDSARLGSNTQEIQPRQEPRSSQSLHPTSKNPTESKDPTNPDRTSKDPETTSPKPQNSKPESRISYFLNLNAPRSSFRSKEPRKTDSSSKSNPKESQSGPNPSNARKNLSRDDHCMTSPPSGDSAFVRGGTRRSLQLPKDRPSFPSRLFSEVRSPSERSVNQGATKIPNIETKGKEQEGKSRKSDCSSLRSSGNGRARAEVGGSVGRDGVERVEDGLNGLDRSFESTLSVSSHKEGVSKSRTSLLSRLTGRPSSAGSVKERTVQTPKTSSALNQHHPATRSSMSKLFSVTTSSLHKLKTPPVNDNEENISGDASESLSPLTAKNISSLTNSINRRKTNKSSKDSSQIPSRTNAESKDRDIDDAASEISDTTSAYSVSGSTAMADVLINLSSSSPSARKDGLSDLQYLLRSGALFSKNDTKRLTEIFTRMFHDPQSRVFSLFAEVLVDFVECLTEDLEDWLPICLNRLFAKLGTDLLGSVNIKVQRALDAVRYTFGMELQRMAVTKFIGEPTNTHNNKVKEAVLRYLSDLSSAMNPSDLTADDDLQVLLGVTIGWSTDAKSSSDARKSAQKLIVSMFNLNPPVFSLALTKQPRTAQDFVRKILHNHLRSAGGMEEIDERRGDEFETREKFRLASRSQASHLDTLGRTSSQKQPHPQLLSLISVDEAKIEKLSSVSEPEWSQRKTDSATLGSTGRQGSVTMRDAKSTGAEQQPLLVSRMSEDSGIFLGPEEARDELSPDSRSPIVFSPREADVNQTVNQTFTVKEGNHGDTENSRTLDEIMNHFDIIVKSIAKDDSWSDVVSILADASSSEEKRKEAMKIFLQSLPTNCKEITDEDLKIRIGTLLLTYGGVDEVSEIADECISLLLKTRTPGSRVEILGEIAETSEYPVNAAALKLQYNELQNVKPADVEQKLTGLVPKLIKAYENNESRVRKASLLSLVHLYKVVGDSLWTHIHCINSNKRNLLALYFKRVSTS